MRLIRYEIKKEAIQLRKKGLALRKIEERLRIPRSTLSGWFKDITLTKRQKQRLLRDWRNGLVKAHSKAVLWHHAEKEKRLREAMKEAERVFTQINIQDKKILDLALAMLYLGEGSKTTVGLSIGNSNPMILQFFIAAISYCYNFDRTKIRCDLHIRADQDPTKIKRYWSHALHLPLKNFITVSIDKRTEGSRTYPTYKGVCVLRFGSGAIQRKLIYLSDLFCRKVVTDLRA